MMQRDVESGTDVEKYIAAQELNSYNLNNHLIF